LGHQTENQALRLKVAELTHLLACTTEEKEFADEQLQERVQTIKAMRAEALEKFAILKSKLSAERHRGDAESLRDEMDAMTERYEKQLGELRERLRSSDATWKSENQKLLETIDDLEKSAHETTTTQISFIASLEELLGCSSLMDAIQKVTELVRGRGPGSQAHLNLEDALHQILINISPNALELPPDSELRQLFAALCNVLTAAIDPHTTKALLMSHVRALVFQARLFAPKRPAEQ
jgi:hypothetical protein